MSEHVIVRDRIVNPRAYIVQVWRIATGEWESVSSYSSYEAAVDTARQYPRLSSVGVARVVENGDVLYQKEKD